MRVSAFITVDHLAALAKRMCGSIIKAHLYNDGYQDDD